VLRGLLILIVSAAVSWLASGDPVLAAEGQRRGRDRLDVDYGADIAASTTEPAFSTEWVDHLPVSRALTSPKAFLGYAIGSPGKLTKPERIHEYFAELGRRSSRVDVVSIGHTDEGREIIVALIGSRKNLRRIEEIKRRNHELANPRITDDARAREIAQSTPAIYWITAGLHASETAAPEMVMELAYRLAVSNQPHIREIRDRVVVMITPVVDPDGRARVVDWFQRHLTDVKDIEDAPPLSPPFWGRYAFHDSNRDGLQQTQRSTRAYTEAFHEYLPVVTLDLHESVPLLYVSTGTGPYNETIDPLTVTQWQWLAGYEVATATRLGLRGVWTWGYYDGWYPGYMLWVANNHNATGRFYETYGNSHPGTFERNLDHATYAGTRVNAREWYRAWPPGKALRWSFRNGINYTQTVVLASLQLAARHGDDLLLDFWRKGRRAVAAGRGQRPHAFLIPREQDDPAAWHRLLELLVMHRIEFGAIERDVSLRGVDHSVDARAGDIVVRLDQPYQAFAKTLLAARPFPKTAKQTPHDDVAWSLDLMLGVDVVPIDDPTVLDLAIEPMTRPPELVFPVEDGSRWIIDHHGQSELASLRWALPHAEVKALAEPWQGHPTGSLVIGGVARGALADVLDRLHLRSQAVSLDADASLIDVDAPKVAVLHTWIHTQDSGWLRYTFEHLGIPFTLIDKDTLRDGSLRQRFDVIVVPSQGKLSLRDMVHELDPRFGPLAYTKTAEFPSHGEILASEDITGGMGFEGLANLEAFVQSGGLLLGLGSGGVIAAEGGITRNVDAPRPGGTPGSHVTTKILRTEHPLVWGYDPIDWVFRGNLPVYRVDDRDWGRTVMQFGAKTWRDVEREADDKAEIAGEPKALAELQPVAKPKPENPGGPSSDRLPRKGKPPFVRSGIVERPEAIDHLPALLDVPVGQGRVVLYSWNPMHRHQNEHDFAFVTNALLFWNDFPPVPTEAQMREREEPDRPRLPSPITP